MKHILLTFGVLATSLGTAWSQTCSVAAIQNQAQIDNFKTTYPGCKVIDSDLHIISTNVVNLDGFSNITAVNGSVRINHNPNLVSIAGFSSLREIGGEINIEGNDRLPDLHGLENFSRPGANVRVTFNKTLTNVSALSRLTSIPGFISIGANPLMTSLDGLQNLVTVGLTAAFAENPSLVDLKALSNLREVRGSYFYLGNDDALKDLQGLENVRVASSSFTVTDCDQITSLKGIENFQNNGAISIYSNRQLTNCAIKMVCERLNFEALYFSDNAPGCNDIDEVVQQCKGPVEPGEPGTARINAGGGYFTATNGKVFASDQYYGGVDRTHYIPDNYDIAGTDDDALYRNERSAASFNYAIPMSNGQYRVILHFAEIWFGAPNGRPGAPRKRLFNIDMEGARMFTEFDVYARAGGAMKALKEELIVNLSDGILNLNFTSGTANLPTIAAIEVIPYTERSVTFTPVADAMVRDGIYKEQNFGSDPIAGVKGGSNANLHRDTYLRFAIPGINSVKSAKLRVYGYNYESANGAPIGAGAVSDDSWTETGITFSNAPAYQNPAQESRTLVRGEMKYWEMDVTEFVRSQAAGDKLVSLALVTAYANNLMNFHSKENTSGFAPQLVILTDDAVSPTARFGTEEKALVETVAAPTSTIYPNPAKDHITLEISSGHKGNVDLQLTSPTGLYFPLQRSVNEANASKMEVNLPTGLPLGIYLLKIQSSTLTETTKVLVTE